MQNSIVTVINRTKARFFVLESNEFEPQPSFNFTEIEALSSSTQELQGQELWSTTKPGRNRGTVGQAHSYDDHRDNHQIEFERRFAREVTTRLAALIQQGNPRQLLLIAEPHLMGIIREILVPELPKNLKLNELTKDLYQLKVHELHQYLTSKALLPT